MHRIGCTLKGNPVRFDLCLFNYEILSSIMQNFVMVKYEISKSKLEIISLFVSTAFLEIFHNYTIAGISVQNDVGLNCVGWLVGFAMLLPFRKTHFIYKYLALVHMNLF